MFGKLLIRADADEKIGSGHIMRCIAVAQAWVRQGGVCHFLVERCPAELVRRIESESCSVIFVGEKRIQDLLTDSEPDVLLVDGFHYSSAYLEQMHSDSYLMAVFDEFGREPPFVADIIINPQPEVREGYYPGYDVQRLLLGLEFLPLRSEFTSHARDSVVPLSERNRILINFGGTDVKRLTLGVVEAMHSRLPHTIGLDVVMGQTHPDYESVMRLAVEHSDRLACHSNVRDMAALMHSAGMAISAAGSTIWELMAMGVPLIPVMVSENQKVVSHYDYWPVSIDAVEHDSRSVIESVVDTANDFWNDQPLRRKYVRRYQGLPLYCGSANIVMALNASSRERVVGQ